MDVLMRFLSRFVVVPLGITMALAVGAAFVVIAHRNTMLAGLSAHPEAQLEYFVSVVFGGPVLAFLLSLWAFYTFVPSLIGVLISEGLAIRSWMFHAANGGLSAWLGWARTQDTHGGNRFLTEPRLLVAAGLAAGLAYWIVAGRTAGFWIPIRSPHREALPPAR